MKRFENMDMEGSGKSYEESRSMVQELTFSVLEDELSQKNIDFGVSQMKNWRLIDEDGLYTSCIVGMS